MFKMIRGAQRRWLLHVTNTGWYGTQFKPSGDSSGQVSSCDTWPVMARPEFRYLAAADTADCRKYHLRQGCHWGFPLDGEFDSKRGLKLDEVCNAVVIDPKEIRDSLAVSAPLLRTKSYVSSSAKTMSKVMRSVPAFLLRSVLASSPRVFVATYAPTFAFAESMVWKDSW